MEQKEMLKMGIKSVLMTNGGNIHQYVLIEELIDAFKPITPKLVLTNPTLDDIAKFREKWEKIPVNIIPSDPMVEIIKDHKSINEYCTEAFETATSKGWHDEEREIGTMLALIHSEVSEALEACRKSNEDNFIEELADVCIRVFDLCGKLQIDLEGAIEAKMLRNKKREYKHGGKAF